MSLARPAPIAAVHSWTRQALDVQGGGERRRSRYNTPTRNASDLARLLVACRSSAGRSKSVAFRPPPSRRLWRLGGGVAMGIAYLILLLFVGNAKLHAQTTTCFVGDEQLANVHAEAQRKSKCRIVCKGCGCKGGPGYLDKYKRCVQFSDLNQRCGPPPHSKCKPVCAPLDKRCNQALISDGPPQVSILDGKALVFESTGQDKDNRRAAFDLIVVHDGLHWEYKSTDRIEQLSLLNPTDKPFGLLKDRLVGASHIIAVGTASSEGSRSSEEARAKNRAMAILELVRPAISDRQTIWLLNLGQFRKDCSDCEKRSSKEQRPVMIVAVGEMETGVAMSDALQSAWSQVTALPTLSSYSLFDLERVNPAQHNR
jgi:hypothetical protein